MRPTGKAELVGAIGYEGGPSPAASSDVRLVALSTAHQPLVINHNVGSTGHFTFSVDACSYTITECSRKDGAASAVAAEPTSRCRRPRTYLSMWSKNPSPNGACAG